MIDSYKHKARQRSKIITGQLKGLQTAIDNDKYCVDILTQSLAIQRSLRSLNKLILENHLKTCAKTGLAKDDEKTIKELLQLYELGNVRS